MRDLSRNEAVGLIALLTMLTVICAWTFLKAGQAVATSGITLRDTFPQAPASPPPIRPGEATSPPTAVEGGEVVVHVAGAVRRPGVYHLRSGARGEEALRAAGGPTPDANTDAVNLAAHLEDGIQLYFPTHTEHPGAAEEAEARVASSGKVTSPTHKAKGKQMGNRSSDKLTSLDQGTIDLNTASAEQLQRIPGIGPAMAARLLTYRTAHHGFKRVEDLLNIGGIGAKKFAKLRPFVRVH